MISNTLGAPLGGTTFGGQPGLESAALRLTWPAKGGGGFGRYLPSMVVVALVEPGVPEVWTCALAEGTAVIKAVATIPLRRMRVCVFMGQLVPSAWFVLTKTIYFAGEIAGRPFANPTRAFHDRT